MDTVELTLRTGWVGGGQVVKYNPMLVTLWDFVVGG